MGVHAILLAAALQAQAGCPSGPAQIPFPSVTGDPDPRAKEPVPTYEVLAAGNPYGAASRAVESGDAAFSAGDNAGAVRDFRRAA